MEISIIHSFLVDIRHRRSISLPHHQRISRLHPPRLLFILYVRMGVHIGGIIGHLGVINQMVGMMGIICGDYVDVWWICEKKDNLWVKWVHSIYIK
mgnify:CR=1 FL=1